MKLDDVSCAFHLDYDNFCAADRCITHEAATVHVQVTSSDAERFQNFPRRKWFVCSKVVRTDRHILHVLLRVVLSVFSTNSIE